MAESPKIPSLELRIHSSRADLPVGGARQGAHQNQYQGPATDNVGVLLYNPPTLLQSSVAKVNGYYDWILKHGLVHKLKDAVSLYQCLDALDTVLSR